MSLATSLQTTAAEIIDKYGNSVTLATVTNDGVYNPQTGEYGTPVAVSFVKKAYIAPITTTELTKLGEGAWGDVSTVATLIEDVDIAGLDNQWTLDGMKVMKVLRTNAQDTLIVTKVYCG